MKKLLAIVVLIYGIAGSQGGTIKLQDGSTIHGKLKLISKGRAELETSIGKLRIPIDKVESMVSEKRLWVALDRTGVLRRHSILYYKDGKYLINGDPSAPVIETSQIEVAWDESSKDPFNRIWNHELSAYYTGRSGNDDRENAGGGYESMLSGPADRLKLHVESLYARRNSVATDNEQNVGADYEWDIDRQDSFYCLADLRHDEIEKIKIRQIYGTGYGRYLLNEPHHKFRTRLGLQYRNELYNDDSRWEGPALDLGILHSYQKDLFGKLATEITYSPRIDTTGGSYLLRHDTSWDLPLTIRSWRLRLGLKNDYNEEPAPGNTEHLDTQYYVRVLYTW